VRSARPADAVSLTLLPLPPPNLPGVLIVLPAQRLRVRLAQLTDPPLSFLADFLARG
jgi:hypothetical protein